MPGQMRTRTFKTRRSGIAAPGQWRRDAVFIAVLYVVGVVVGALLYLSMPHALRIALVTEVRRSVATGAGMGRAGIPEAFLEAFASVCLILWFWFCAQASTVGGMMIAISLFLRAVSLGLALSLLTAAYAWRGVEFDLLGVLPWNILVAGVLILAAAPALTVSRAGSSLRQDTTGVRVVFSIAMLGCIACALAVGWLEAWSAPHAMGLLVAHTRP